ncbi:MULTISPECIES: LemA family protein [Tenacibaculum]|uniref:LemA family protein n=1 Tax=Tenacibaculum TaxID=104267 RepID=UPI000DEA1F81|nr:LemA family protein [Tenacibaculum sp. E3R01]RBW55238.1 LemA family protein [Tenacibaculum sp. E3R01]
MKKWLVPIIILVIGFFIVSWGIGVNNEIVELKGEAEIKWANVESSYQRRNDLIGNLVKTVQGAADFEKSTLTDVINARAKATSVNINAGDLTPEKMAQFQQAQQGLTGALSKLLVSVERYPDIKANKNFLELQSQLEGTENRIKIARDRFNKMAGKYNIFIEKIPNNLVASFRSFTKMRLYQSDAGSENAPNVDFKF